MTAARVRVMTDAECSAFDEVAPRGTGAEALAGWVGALVIGVSTLAVAAAALGRAL